MKKGHLEELPELQPLWPCRRCGAEQAPSYNVDDEGAVTDCANCAPRSKGEHLDSNKCWCRPELTYADERGTQVWTHRRMQ